MRRNLMHHDRRFSRAYLSELSSEEHAEALARALSGCIESQPSIKKSSPALDYITEALPKSYHDELLLWLEDGRLLSRSSTAANVPASPLVSAAICSPGTQKPMKRKQPNDDVLDLVTRVERSGDILRRLELICLQKKYTSETSHTLVTITNGQRRFADKVDALSNRWDLLKARRQSYSLKPLPVILTPTSQSLLSLAEDHLRTAVFLHVLLFAQPLQEQMGCTRDKLLETIDRALVPWLEQATDLVDALKRISLKVSSR
ncbi:hypothetical protein HGRIS_008274 [Hohenbuehelia grisea]